MLINQVFGGDFINCPQCGNEMKFKENWIERCAIPYWDCDYVPSYPVRKYKCRDCKITYTEDESNPYTINKSWKIPKQYLPTEKQIIAIKAIDYYLGTDGKETAVTKISASKFISRYMKESLASKKNKAEPYEYDDIPDWSEEHY